MDLDWARLLASIAIPQLAGLAGAVATRRAIPGWYRTLRRPPLTPPDRAFGLAWSILYLLMGLALYIVWGLGTATPGVRLALWLFAIQMLLNALWSFAFFGLRSTTAGLAEIALLWPAVVATTWAFFGGSTTAGWLMVPYVLWVSFATYLNAGFWWLNSREGTLPTEETRST